jgi:hypothetical protein
VSGPGNEALRFTLRRIRRTSIFPSARSPDKPRLGSRVVTAQALCRCRRRLATTNTWKISDGKYPINRAVPETVEEGRGLLTQSERFSVDRGCSRWPTAVTVKREKTRANQWGAGEEQQGYLGLA